MGFGKANVYERIVAELKSLIEAGVLAYGEKLPSVRIYAVEHKVNPNTVAKAYAALEEEGYIEVQPKKGGFVCYGKGSKRTENAERMQRLLEWKEQGVTRAEMELAIRQIYGGEDND